MEKLSRECDISVLDIQLKFGSLIFVTITDPYISLVAHSITKFMQTPQQFHFSAVRQIIKYLISTSKCGLFFPTPSI
ncbi:hypothetical protein PHAVU_003G049400 [Phaseolus vulgaris]|uniref:Reverse transcriptase Ty1/copia-type domain-containing protein n=1 Tax=Phaseolus vulgaris TaxID=3885 RepID=V7C631_PHAVU|nr:hypothetical protein PHAVU_003G049400g [Phaseolus vulgaris]ESW25594.1 hypothetical protein PHAVU_003G049400g [Phaseolus vulgaris]